MNFCSIILILASFAVLLAFVVRKPSDKEIKRFNSKFQEKVNWSRMGF